MYSSAVLVVPAMEDSRSAHLVVLVFLEAREGSFTWTGDIITPGR